MGPEKCPFCGQEIDTEATKCFFCGAELDVQSIENRLEQLHKEDDRKTGRKVRCPFVLQAVVIIILICVALFSGTSKRASKSIETRTTEDSSIRLNAKVTYTGAQFVISNNDSYDWMNVELQIRSETIGSNFNFRVSKISAGQTYTVRATEFSIEDGTHFNPYKMKPKRFRIWCESPNRENGSYSARWK